MKLGMILVLFILLVIVTNVFSRASNPDDANPPVGITGTQTFNIENRSTNYRLRFFSRTGPANLPENSTLPPGTSTAYVVRTSGLSPVYVTTVYNVYDLSNNKVGYFTFWIDASDFIAFAYFKDDIGYSFPSGVGARIAADGGRTIIFYEVNG
ncbi:hypothetical protein SAMN05444162_0692 [Paenibacillaceae bacterium GAS479]|nr:hypothetical protein SAMN05444162_0692 [Paenibacillaceae bacterium GAS479]